MMRERMYPKTMMLVGWIFLAGSLPLIWAQVSARLSRPWDPYAGMGAQIHALSLLAIPSLLCIAGMHVWLAVGTVVLCRRRQASIRFLAPMLGVIILLVGLYMPQSAYQSIWIKTGGPGHNPNRVMPKVMSFGNQAAITALLEAGASPNGRVDEKTYLMVAAERGQTSLVRELLSKGADPSGRPRAVIEQWTSHNKRGMGML